MCTDETCERLRTILMDVVRRPFQLEAILKTSLLPITPYTLIGCVCVHMATAWQLHGNCLATGNARGAQELAL